MHRHAAPPQNQRGQPAGLQACPATVIRKKSKHRLLRNLSVLYTESAGIYMCTGMQHHHRAKGRSPQVFKHTLPHQQEHYHSRTIDCTAFNPQRLYTVSVGVASAQACSTTIEPKGAARRSSSIPCRYSNHLKGVDPKTLQQPASSPGLDCPTKVRNLHASLPQQSWLHITGRVATAPQPSPHERRCQQHTLPA